MINHYIILSDAWAISCRIALHYTFDGKIDVTQFRADVKPKITSPRKPERAVDPLSDSFKRVITASGGRLSKVTDAMASGGRMAPSGTALSVGNTIEHQRFGIGTVLNIEGSGENTKATVEFRNAGTKQLLLKFARYKIIG